MPESGPLEPPPGLQEAKKTSHRAEIPGKSGKYNDFDDEVLPKTA
jgi:hypothetical protein